MIARTLKIISRMNSTKNEEFWNPWYLLHPEKCSVKYAVLVLNTPIFWKVEFLVPFWSQATIKVLVDGGSNRWFHWLQLNNANICGIPNPTIVTGDMDSIDKNLLDNFKTNGTTKVIYTPDQNETDFTKTLREIKKYANEMDNKVKDVITVVDTCGRFDQIMGNVQTLFHCKKFAPELNVYLLGADSISWLISPGKHKILVPEQLQKTWCALIPIGKKCERISTTGLKWNLENQTLSFGELVSTSNTYDGLGHVTIDTSDTIVWSMGLSNIPTNYKEYS